MELLITQTELEQHISAAILIQLTDDGRDGVADSAVVTQILTTATNLVNDLLEPRYSAYVPFTVATLPAVLKGILRDIAAFEVYSRRNRVPDIITYRYELALQRLKEYASGRMPLLADTAMLTKSNEDDVVSSHTASDRRLTRETLAGFTRSFLP